MPMYANLFLVLQDHRSLTLSKKKHDYTNNRFFKFKLDEENEAVCFYDALFHAQCIENKKKQLHKAYIPRVLFIKVDYGPQIAM